MNAATRFLFSADKIPSLAEADRRMRQGETRNRREDHTERYEHTLFEKKV